MNQGSNTQSTKQRCAIYTRKSSEEGLEQEFNSLHAQREACEAYIKSQQHEGWVFCQEAYDDGGFSGGNIDRPALTRLINDIKQNKVDIIVVYKIDRLSRSLADFVRLVELCDQQGVSFVSITQQFNTSTSMGRLTLNVLLSFAQFEREVTSERIRDKIGASKRKGLWMGGMVPLGYDIKDKKLIVNKQEAKTVKHIYERYLALGCVRKLKIELDQASYVSKARPHHAKQRGQNRFSRGALYTLLKNPLYIGKIHHKGKHYDGQHKAIINEEQWQLVQQQLAKNRKNKLRRTAAKCPSLLAGLIFDDNNNPMSPTHTIRKNQRFHYYVSQAVLQFRENEAGSVTRVPAHSVEDVVIKELLRILEEPNLLLQVVPIKTIQAHHQQILIEKAANLAGKWCSLTPHQHIEYLNDFIEKILVGRNKIKISITRHSFIKTLLNDVLAIDEVDLNINNYELSVPVKLKRCGLETRFIVAEGDTARAHPKTVKAIQNALLKALFWNDALISGRISSMTALAREEHVTQRYVAHLIKLAFLAPDIIEAIKHGNIPATLSLDRLKKGFPLDWNEQRKLLGFRH